MMIPAAMAVRTIFEVAYEYGVMVVDPGAGVPVVSVGRAAVVRDTMLLE